MITTILQDILVSKAYAQIETTSPTTSPDPQTDSSTNSTESTTPTTTVSNICNDTQTDPGKCKCPNNQIKSNQGKTTYSCYAACDGTQPDVNSCSCNETEKQAKDSNGKYVCLKPGDNMGINCTANQMVNGTCSMNVYTLLGIRKDTPNPSAGVFINDVVLSATFFIGTVVTIAIIYAGRELIRSSSTGDAGNVGDAQKKIINALIGLALVSLSYTIIRLIQYLAAG